MSGLPTLVPYSDKGRDGTHPVGLVSTTNKAKKKPFGCATEARSSAVEPYRLRRHQTSRFDGQRQPPWKSDDSYPGLEKRGMKRVAQVVERVFRGAGASPC